MMYIEEVHELKLHHLKPKLPHLALDELLGMPHFED